MVALTVALKRFLRKGEQLKSLTALELLSRLDPHACRLYAEQVCRSKIMKRGTLTTEWLHEASAAAAMAVIKTLRDDEKTVVDDLIMTEWARGSADFNRVYTVALAKGCVRPYNI
jgi:hypothetical protein